MENPRFRKLNPMNTGAPRAVQARAFRLPLVVSNLVFSCLAMLAVHEFGHALFAWSSEGAVARVVLSPLELSRTDLQKNPHPLFVASGGALVGVALPLLVSGLCRLLRWPAWYILRFSPGFRLVPDCIYLAVVSFIPNTADPTRVGMVRPIRPIRPLRPSSPHSRGNGPPTGSPTHLLLPARVAPVRQAKVHKNARSSWQLMRLGPFLSMCPCQNPPKKLNYEHAKPIHPANRSASHRAPPPRQVPGPV